MAEDKSVVKPLEAPPLAPFKLKSQLADTPKQAPKYLVKVKNSQGQPVVLGDPRATRALVALMDVHAVNGGAACHWGGPAAFAEIMAAIHGIMVSVTGREWHEAFNFVNDAGHTENGVYALRANYGFDGMTFEDLKPFRSIKSKFTGHGESHLNPEGVLLSNGPLGSALPQSQGLAIADKVAKRDRVTICTMSAGAAVEGEAKEAFAAIPGLAAKARGFPLATGEKIVDWVNEIYSGHQPPEEFLDWAKALRLDWEQKEAAKKAKAAASPTATAPAVKKDKVQSGLAKAAVRAAQEGLPVYSISADVQGSTGISLFQKSLPDRFIEVGIAEANMISTGAGFAKAGFIPIVDTFGQFGVTKGNLPLTMAALSQAPVIALFSHVGFQDAADGASHQATTYLAATSAIPHTIVIAPSCSDEAEAFMYQAIKRYAVDRASGKDGDTYIFFVGRENYPLSWVENARYEWGRAQVLQEGSDVVLVACGPLLSKAIEAGKKLAEQNIKATVINNPFINRVGLDTIGAAVKTCSGRVATIEDHQVIGGMGAQVSHALSQAGITHRIKSLGIHGEFGQSAYVAEHLYEKHGLTAKKRIEAALTLIDRKQVGMR